MWNPVKTAIMFAALCPVGLMPVALAGGAVAQSDQSAYCEEFAQDFAGKNARETDTGIDLNSALAGAAEGAILGEVLDGRRNRRRDARRGAAIGVASAGIDFRPRFDRLYRRAFATCMAQ